MSQRTKPVVLDTFNTLITTNLCSRSLFVCLFNLLFCFHCKAPYPSQMELARPLGLKLLIRPHLGSTARSSSTKAIWTLLPVCWMWWPVMLWRCKSSVAHLNVLHPWLHQSSWHRGFLHLLPGNWQLQHDLLSWCSWQQNYGWSEQLDCHDAFEHNFHQSYIISNIDVTYQLKWLLIRRDLIRLVFASSTIDEC